jgi:hypothetical protein
MPLQMALEITVKFLDQLLVTRYAKYHALQNLLEKWLKERRLTILELLNAGARCPDKGPFLIELGDAKGKPNWKEEFRAHLIRTGCTESGAEILLQNISNAEREKEPRLYCKANPNYKRKFPIRLPR